MLDASIKHVVFNTDDRVQKTTSSSGLYVGLQTLADTDGEKLWKKLYFRYIHTHTHTHTPTNKCSTLEPLNTRTHCNYDLYILQKFRLLPDQGKCVL